MFANMNFLQAFCCSFFLMGSDGLQGDNHQERLQEAETNPIEEDDEPR